MDPRYLVGQMLMTTIRLLIKYFLYAKTDVTSYSFKCSTWCEFEMLK